MDYNQNHQMYLKGNEYDEFISRGISYLNSPSLILLHDRILSYLQEMAFYIVRLKKLGITNEKIKDLLIESFSGMIVNTDYEPEYFLSLINLIYAYTVQAKELYLSACRKNNLEPEILKSVLKNPQKLSLADMIKEGQKGYAKKVKKFTPIQENFTTMIFNIGKNIFIYLVELKEFGIDEEEIYYGFFEVLNAGNTYITYAQKELTDEYAKTNQILAQELNKVITERYGDAMPTEVSCSIKPGKAILVSGSNLRELEMVLEATKDKGIDIYTHDNLIVAHAYQKFKTYSHLVGHVGKCSENYLIDFTNFPGSILMTRHSLQRVENLYRGGIFTMDIIAPQGVVMIKDNNFEPLIKSAIRAEGFEEKIQKPPVKLNFSEKQFLEKIAEVAQKIEQGEIKHFFVIGTSDCTQIQKEYFDKFLHLLGNDCFVLSFSYTTGRSNVLSIQFNDNWFNNFYKALEVLTQKIKIKNLNPIVLYTKWGLDTFSNVVCMKNMGINKIYLPVCSPNLFNPFFINGFQKIYDLKNYTNPEDDLKDMLEK